MELKQKDVYRVISKDVLSEDALTSLLSLYQPLIGGKAVNLYLTLHSEGRVQKTMENHDRLSMIMHLTIEEIERARIHLEEYLLIRTYVNEQDSKNTYIYVLNAPLSVQNFLSSTEFRNAFASKIGTKNAEITISKLTMSTSFEGYQDITRKIAYMPKESAFNNNIEFNRIKPNYSFDEDEQDILFDYDRFIRSVSNLTFPVELRTRENMKLIGQLATLYGLSPERMVIHVQHCLRGGPAEQILDLDELKLKASRDKPDIKLPKDGYSLPPVSFLQSKQNGMPVSAADKKILEWLTLETGFSMEIINIFVEYILNISDNKLVMKFVQMKAGEWARNGVSTKEQAIAETKKENTWNKNKRKDIIPEYYDKQDEKPEAASEEDIMKAQEFLKRLGKHGKD